MTKNINSIQDLKTSISRDKFLIMQCGHVRIAITSDAISLPKQLVEEHDHFEFFIPLSNMTSAYIDKKKFDCQPGNIVAINPGQVHGMQRNTRNSVFITLFFERDFMERIITEVAGELQYFPNYVQNLRPEIQRSILKLVEEYRESLVGRAQMMTSLSVQLALSLIRFHHLPSISPVQDIQSTLSLSQKRFADVVTYMSENMEDKITIDQMAQRALMNRFHFIRSFKSAFGSSPYDYLTNLRIIRAKQLLSNTQLSANDIGRDCGYSSASRFSAAFKMLTGMTPSAYRQLIVAERRHLLGIGSSAKAEASKRAKQEKAWYELTSKVEISEVEAVPE